jgi:hypothetical protein
MERNERIFLLLAGVALAALVLWDMRGKQAAQQPADTSPLTNPYAAATAEGPSYLLYNQPWFFVPPVGNFMPQQTAGQAGQTLALTPAQQSTAVCTTCG